jgi:polysaccharide export outer membrane protein
VRSLIFVSIIRLSLLSAWVLIGGGWLAAQAEYHVGPGDTLKVEVPGEADFSGDLQVNANGAITLKMIGDIPVAGLTVIEIRDKLVDILGRDYLLNPTVKVEISEYRSKKILVLGEVRKPGEFFLQRDWIGILEVLSLTGGMTEHCGDQVVVFRKGGEPTADGSVRKQEIEIQRVLRGESDSEDHRIYPGDIVNFPSRQSDGASYQVFVEGKVKNPGVYEFHPGMTVYELCMKAGGFAPFSAENRTLIVREEDGKVIRLKVNLKKIKQGDLPDVPLKPADKVIVPGSRI